MAQCIVCRADYRPDPDPAQSTCQRCGTSQEAWDNWREDDLFNVLAYIGLPMLPALILLTVAIVLGVFLLLRAPTLYASGVGLVFLAVTTILSLTGIASAALRRYSIRERILLAQAGCKTRDWGFGTSPVATILISLLFAFILTTIVVLSVALVGALIDEETGIERLFDTPTATQGIGGVSTPTPGQVTVVSVYTPTPGPMSMPTPQPTPGPGSDQPWLVSFVRTVLIQMANAWPLYFGSLYVALVVSSVYVLAVGALNSYFDKLNEGVLPPIFLNPALLLSVVQQEVIEYLGAAPGEVTWQDLERTDACGYKLTARHRHDSKRVEDLVGRRTHLPMYRKYEIEADQWGRLRTVKADQETGM